MSKAGVASASWTSTALAGNLPRMGVSFESAVLTEDTEVTGPVVLVLWVSSTTEDIDIFATIRNIAPNGEDVFERGQQSHPVPVAKGWLRASHRKLDPSLTLPYRPYHTHEDRQWLKADEVVRIDVEIWPTCMVFRKGHRIRLDIQRATAWAAFRTHTTARTTTPDHVIHTGGAAPPPCASIVPGK